MKQTKAKLKSVPSKMSFKEYLKLSGVNQFNTVLPKVLNAYADCLPEHVDQDGLERDLDFLSRDPVSLELATKIMLAACPDGYNGFNASAMLKIGAIFGDDCLVFLARESSVCIYIKPIKGNVWLDRGGKSMSQLADEVCFDANLGMFRLWWD